MAASQAPPDDGDDESPPRPRIPMPVPQCGPKMLTEHQRDWVAGVLYDPQNEDAWLESSLLISRGLMR